MVKRRLILSRLLIGFSLVAVILLLGTCGGERGGKNDEIGKKGKFASGNGYLLYFKSSDTTVPVTPTVSTTGGPTSNGDQVAWVLMDSNLSITSLTFPAAGCGTSNVPSTWTPYPSPAWYQQYAFSGPLTPPPGGTSNGSYNLYYKIRLSDGSGPCGRIIINKGSLEK
jgi:hypothetical protein